MSRNLTDTYATGAVVAAQSDSENLPKAGFLYVGVSGDVKVSFPDGSTVVFTALAAGIVHPILVSRVWSSATTATNILIVY